MAEAPFDRPPPQSARADDAAGAHAAPAVGGLLAAWRRRRARRRDARRIGDAMRVVVARLEAGCPESELNEFTCPECGGPLQFEVNPRRPEGILHCSRHRTHLLEGIGHPYWARPASMPSWWAKYRHPELWDD